MKFKPKKGRAYWYVTDFWEVFYPIPVTFDGKCYKWHLGDGLYECFYDYEVRPQRLFRKKKSAARAAAKLNEGVKEICK